MTSWEKLQSSHEHLTRNLTVIRRRFKSGWKPSLQQSTAVSAWWCGPRARLSWIEMAVGLPEVHPRHSSHTNHLFAVLPSERSQKGSTQASLKSADCFLSFSRILMSGYVINVSLPPSFPAQHRRKIRGAASRPGLFSVPSRIFSAYPPHIFRQSIVKIEKF